MTKFLAQLTQLEKAINRLAEALAQEKNDFMRDSAIQRFTFTFDLSWKTIKSYLTDVHGVACNSPKSCLRAGFQNNLIVDEDGWLLLTDMRNETVHTYNEALADKIYNQLPHSLKLFQILLAALKK